MDNLGERLLLEGIRVARIGHPARASEAIQPHCLNVLVDNEWQTMEDINLEIEEITKKLHKQGTRKLTKAQISGPGLAEQLKQLKKKRTVAKKKLEAAKIKHLKEASVVLSTLTGCKDKGPLSLLPKDYFNTCVIDECAQSLEMACWIAIHKVSSDWSIFSILMF